MARSGLVLFILLLVSCRAGKGESCLCAADCKAGLVCAIEGSVLGDGECSPKGAAQAGTCVPSDDVPMDGTDTLPTTGPYMDMGSKLDFEPEPPPTTSTGATSTSTSTSTDSTSTGSDTGTSTSTTGP